MKPREERKRKKPRRGLQSKVARVNRLLDGQTKAVASMNEDDAIQKDPENKLYRPVR